MKTKKIKKQLDTIRKKDTKSVYFWNTVASFSYSFQSVFILIVLARTCDIVAAGIFSIAWTTGNLLMNLGKYGMRNFQVSDVTDEFSFAEYLGSRVVTCLLMIIALIGYLIFAQSVLEYTIDKIYVVIALCLMKGIDAFEDVYHGHYQKNENLEVASKLLFARINATTIIMCIVAALTADLLTASIAGTVFSAVFFIASIVLVGHKYQYPIFQIVEKQNFKKVGRLLKAAFPLFISAFLMFYICNAPKYGIDACMTDVEQAYYGYIAMPAFIVGLFATFVYNPIIVKISHDWEDGKIKEFAVEFAKQVLIIVGLTLLFMGIMATIGIPILNILYATNLDMFTIESVILMAAGGFLALATLISVGITIIRKQYIMLPIYILVTIISVLINEPIVRSMGIMGASLEYLILMVILAALLSLYFVIQVIKARKEKR